MAITLDQAPRPTTTEYATFWQRLLAAVLDFVFTLPLFFGVSYFMTFSPNYIGYLVVSIIAAAYRPVLEGLFGATFGKMVCKLKVVRADNGEQIGWEEAAFRFLPWLVPVLAGGYYGYRLFGLPGYLEIDGFVEMGVFMQQHMDEIGTLGNVTNLTQLVPLISALFIFGSARNQALHDRLARTVVVVK